MDTRVVVYLLRKLPNENQLLVYQTQDGESGLQVIKGKIDPGETPEEAMRREIREESGLTQISDLRPIGIVQHKGDEPAEWHLFAGWVQDSTVDEFDHSVEGKGKDKGRVFRFKWVPVLQRPGLHQGEDIGFEFLERYKAETAQAGTMGRDD